MGLLTLLRKLKKVAIITAMIDFSVILLMNRAIKKPGF